MPTGTFSNASLSGDFATVSIGTGGNGVSTTGVLTADGIGGFMSVLTQNDNGTVTVENQNGTYQLAADGALTVMSGGNTSLGFINNDADFFILAGNTAGNLAGQAITIGIKKPTGVFSNSSINGDFTRVAVGIDGGSPFVVTGPITVDGNGNFTTSSETKNNNGTITMGNSNGTYVVALDGSVTMTEGANNIEGFISGDGNSFILGGNTSGSIATQMIVIGLKKPAGTFNNSSANGNFMFVEFGNNGGAPFATVGTINADGNGGFTSTFTENDNGTVSTTGTNAGTYTINTDGSLTFISNSGGTFKGTVSGN